MLSFGRRRVSDRASSFRAGRRANDISCTSFDFPVPSFSSEMTRHFRRGIEFSRSDIILAVQSLFCSLTSRIPKRCAWDFKNEVVFLRPSLTSLGYAYLTSPGYASRTLREAAFERSRRCCTMGPATSHWMRSITFHKVASCVIRVCHF